MGLKNIKNIVVTKISILKIFLNFFSHISIKKNHVSLIDNISIMRKKKCLLK